MQRRNVRIFELVCRYIVDFMLFASKAALRDKHPDIFPEGHSSDESACASTMTTTATTTTTTTPPADKPTTAATILPELDIEITVTDANGKEKICVKGRADWGYGCGSGRRRASTFFIAVKAATRERFSRAESELLAYLAIVREQRRRAGKADCAVQGFFTDGNQYRFMSIGDDGVVMESDVYFIVRPDHTKTIFNFVATILESAVRNL
ncbi:hypothetical protein GP486_008689 [Trichoglossum hirsutum]|uniref:Uncharacterized protein n=1 Tax=Trichoglossum hirsutum TaxID=265104 RepID=A0A9P8I1X0_9PEZI|nr:hypothetical protein GP486_008689 [Trichoglossum hirsutum]